MTFCVLVIAAIIATLRTVVLTIVLAKEFARSQE